MSTLTFAITFEPYEMETPILLAYLTNVAISIDDIVCISLLFFINDHNYIDTFNQISMGYSFTLLKVLILCNRDEGSLLQSIAARSFAVNYRINVLDIPSYRIMLLCLRISRIMQCIWYKLPILFRRWNRNLIKEQARQWLILTNFPISVFEGYGRCSSLIMDIYGYNNSFCNEWVNFWHQIWI